MHDRVDLIVVKQLLNEWAILHVTHNQFTRGNGCGKTGREIVQHDDLMPDLVQQSHHVRTDVASTT